VLRSPFPLPSVFSSFGFGTASQPSATQQAGVADIAAGSTSRPATPNDRHAFTRLADPNGIPAALRWLVEDTRHANVVVGDVAGITGARREIKRILKSRSQECVYLDNMQAQKDLEHAVRVDAQGAIRIEEGPFKKLLRTGGTLMINVSRFSPQQLEAFNTLMEEQVWEGARARRPVRVVFLCDTGTLQKNLLSGAQISRTAFRDLSGHAFPDSVDVPVMPAQSGHPADARIINLEGDPLWQRKLFGGPKINERQQWEQMQGLLDADFQCPVVLRNAPDDPYLKDLVAEWIQAGKNVRFEAGVPPEEFERRIASKRRATPGDLRQLAHPDAPVCVVNALNIDDTLHSYIGVQGGAPTLLRSHLRAARARLPEGELPLVLVGSDLAQPLWDKLMLHRAGFCVAAAPGVAVPSKYGQYVAMLEQDAVRSSNPRQPVSFLLSADHALANIPQGYHTAHLFVTPSMRANELVSSLERQADSELSGAAALPPLKVSWKQLARDLRNGKTVVLHGLENNPGLASDLATLLHPPHYLDINGKRYHFGRDGGLKGSLLVVTGDPDLCNRHGLSPMRSRSIGNDEQWKKTVQEKLLADFHNRHHDAIRTHLPQIFKLFEAMQGQGLIPRRTPLVSYLQVETLVRHLFVRDAPQDDPEQFHKRLFRSFLKDMLIGDHRRTEWRQDERYEQLKFLLRSLFPEQMEALPGASVDIRRLQSLLLRVAHPKDIGNLAWRFLNCFSMDVAAEIVNDAPGAANAMQKGRIDDNMQERTLLLVLEQAMHHRLRLPPLLTEEVWRCIRRGQLPADDMLQAYERPPKMGRDRKNRGKAELAQSVGNAVIFKGPPGAGKTHMSNVMAQAAGSSRHVGNIADIGTQPYADALQAWADDDAANRPVFIVDEFNLARDGSHDMLRAIPVDGTLVVNGKRSRVSREHGIIFTGNADSFPGRSPQGVAETFDKVQFKAMDESGLRAHFVAPLLDHALSLPRIRRAAGLRAYVEAHAANIHTTLQQAYPEKNLSPRNLEEYVSQIVCRLRSRKQAITAEALAPWMARLALNVYGGTLPAEDGPLLEAWLRHRFGLTPQARLPGMPSVSVKALKTAGLAPTAATCELADSVAWWLKSQQLRDEFNHKQKTLGQKALLIEGPASRGKDDVVKAVLAAKGIDYVHINANPYNLQHLRDTIEEARRDGRIVVISELNLLPSDMLEGEFNALLTGDVPAAPGFGIIATVNPSGYAGRKPLSPALENRMLKVVIGDYPEQELHAIAHSLARKARRRMARGFISVPYGWIARKTVKSLVRRHQALSGDLAAYPGEHRPKIREMRDTIQALSSRRSMRLDEAFDSNYAYYQRLAGVSDGAALNVMHAGEADADTRMKEQLSRLLYLSRPAWLSQPELVADPALPLAVPLDYDTQSHRLRFSPLAPPSLLYAALLSLMDDGVQLAAAGDGAAMPMPAGLPAGAGPQATFLGPAVGVSGVGSADLPGYIGDVDNDLAGGTYLVRARLALDNSLMPEGAAGFSTAVQDSELVTERRIRLKNIAGSPDASGGFRMHLPVPHGTRPANVRIGRAAPEMVFRDEQGGWYVLAQRQTVLRLQYRLAPIEEPVRPAPQEQLFFSGLDMTPNTGGGTGAIDAILALANANRGRRPEEIVAALMQLFGDARYFSYSKRDAEALGRHPDTAGRCQHFLEHGLGVCHEFATAFAAVLEQVFRIPTRLCNGYRSENGKIPRQMHRWVEYRDSEGRWHVVDPTAVAARDVQAGAVPERTGSAAASAAQEHRQLPVDGTDARTHPEGSVSSKGSTSGNFHDIYGDDAFILPPGLLAHFSPAKLGLEYWDIQNDGTRYKPIGNRLVLERLLRGETDIYLDQSASASARVRTVVLEDLPAFADDAEWRRFLVKMTRPLQALIESGVPVLFYNEGDEVERMTSSRSLQQWKVPGPDVDRVKPGDDTRLAIGRHSGPFLERLASHYYESVLATNRVDPQDRDAVIECIFDDLEPVIANVEDSLFPLRIMIGGTAIDLELDDLVRNQIGWIMDRYTRPTQQITKLFELLSLRDATFITPETDPLLHAIDALLTPEFIRVHTSDGQQKLNMFGQLLNNLVAGDPDGLKAWYLQHALGFIRGLQHETDLQSAWLVDALDSIVACLEDGSVNINDPQQQSLLEEIFRQFPAGAIDDWRAAEAIGLRFANWLEPNLDAGFGVGGEFQRVFFGGRPGAREA
jgi:MoxR-like ATPase